MENRDEKLWKVAQKRVNTKRNGYIYLTVVLLLWLIWLASNGFQFRNIYYAWPIWPTIALAVAFIFEYIDAFYRDNETLIEKEYEKLTRKK